MKLRIKIVDVPATATGEEAERLLNAPYAEGYYSDKLVFPGLPEGIGARAFFKLRVKPERCD
jgi:hypothetical protein